MLTFDYLISFDCLPIMLCSLTFTPEALFTTEPLRLALELYTVATLVFPVSLAWIISFDGPIFKFETLLAL